MGLADFTLDVHQLGRLGSGLSRPENVLAFRDGTVFASNDQGPVVRIEPDGAQSEIGTLPGDQPTTMALESDEALLVNNTADGNVYRLHLDGRHELYLDTVEGRPLGSANHVFKDRRGRVWIVVATRRRPPHTELRVEPDGYVVLVDERGARVVYDGLRWPNEIRLNADETYAYIPETLGRRILRFPIESDGQLGPPEAFGPALLGETILPDGIALDRDGNVWVATLAHNGLMIVSADGSSHTVFEEPVADALVRLGAAYRDGIVPLATLRDCAGPRLRLLSSVGFAGAALTRVVMGSLAMSELVTFQSPVPGLPLVHQDRPRAPRSDAGRPASREDRLDEPHA